MVRALIWPTAAVSTFWLLFLLNTDALAQDQPARIVMSQDTDEWHTGSFSTGASVQRLESGCGGIISELPSFILDLEQDGWVEISLMPGDDQGAALVLRRGGETRCADNRQDRDEPLQIEDFLVAGEYYLYVGRLDGVRPGEFRLHVQGGPTAVANRMRRNRAMRFTGISGGEAEAASRLAGCPGAISLSPNHVVFLGRPMQLDLSVKSTNDLTLLVIGETGARCSDDSLGSLDPRLTGWFPEGTLRIWVGSHNPRVRASYTLDIVPLHARQRAGHLEIGEDTGSSD
ncbi:MAG: hypothetical protein JW797_11390 [Bradymonadales bacterium]|nr:hypothetical protein [Bradymonadales bacterium]